MENSKSTGVESTESASNSSPDVVSVHSTLVQDNTIFGVLPLGCCLLVISALLFSVASLFVKTTSTHLPVLQVISFRSIFQLLLALLVCGIMRVNPFGPSNKRFLLVCRGSLGMTSLALYYFSISCLPLSDAVAIFFLNPIFVSVFACVWLKEALNKSTIFAALVSFAGVVLVARPTFIFGSATYDGTSRADVPLHLSEG
eukprot:Platyproteum_vivax@DN5243_c0_g1_i1.p1